MEKIGQVIALANGMFPMKDPKRKNASKGELLEAVELVNLIAMLIEACSDVPKTQPRRLPPAETWKRFRPGRAANRKWLRQTRTDRL